MALTTIIDANEASDQIRDYATDPRLDKEIKDFLKGLITGGRRLETLTPKEARQMLVDAQASVKVDLSEAVWTFQVVLKTDTSRA